jgi:hypothetical protein
MNKMIRSSACLALAALPLLAAVDLRQWQYRKRITIPDSTMVAHYIIDRETFGASREDLADLRMMRNGIEVPFTVDTLRPPAPVLDWTALEILDKGYRPDAGLELTLRYGGKRTHNRVRLETKRRNFRSEVRIESSEDGKRWAVLRDAAPIFDFTTDEHSYSSRELTYPLSTRPFLRLTVKGWTDPADITGASIAQVEQAPPVLVTAIDAASPAGVENRERAATEYVIDLGLPNIPQDRVFIDAEGAMFHRAVEIHTSADNEHWWRHAGGTIFRAAGEDSLELTFNESRRRYLRVRIYNGDNPPLKIRRIRVSGLPYRVRFPSEGPGEAWLYYGNPDAMAPDYDFGRILLRTGEVKMTLATVGAQEKSPDYVPPPAKKKPWTEEHPALLWTVLIAAVAALGGISIKLLRGGPEETAPPA